MLLDVHVRHARALRALYQQLEASVGARRAAVELFDEQRWMFGVVIVVILAFAI